jgi:O-antigen biosynthesis protein
MLRFLSTRYAITFIAYGADPPYRTEGYVQALEALGIEVHVRTFRRRHFWRVRAHAIVFEAYPAAEWWLDTVRLLSPALPIIVDSVDLHYLRELRMSELEPTKRLLQQALETRARELAVYRRADAVIVVTDNERRILAEEVSGLEVMVVPSVQDIDGDAVDGAARIPGSLLFVGGFAHTPNVDAVVYFCRDVLPLIRKVLPSTPVWIVGASPPDEVRAFGSLPGVEITGHVPDLGVYLRKASISIAPLRYGAGIKGKITEAMAAGLPVVTTPIGAEGMHLENRITAMIADSAVEFAGAVTELSGDPVLHAAIARNGLAHARQHYAPAVMEDGLVRLLDLVGSRSPKRISLVGRLRVLARLIDAKARHIRRRPDARR